jgi:membrane associated rhomboid family serine protease
VDTETSLPTCYRHPDRETRLACSACGRPACVDCVRSAAVGQKCVDCARPEGGSRVISADQIRRQQTSSAPVALGILLVCVALFLITQVDREGVLVAYGAQFNSAVQAGEWWRLLTSAFLHANLTHILFNMWALWVFGPELERRVGSVSFAVLYVSSALAGGAAFFFLAGLDVGPAVGASGAIFGLFGAWTAEALHDRHTLTGRANLNQLLVLLGINAALPLLIPHIAWQAHLGGFVAGFGIAFLWAAVARGSGRALARILIAGAFGMAALALVVLF